MTDAKIKSIQSIFSSRLETLKLLLQKAEEHFGKDDAFLQHRIAPDMFPLGTQIAFTCNQPRHFALWCQGKEVDNLSPEVKSLQEAYGHIEGTQQLLSSISCDDAKLQENKRIALGKQFYAELQGAAYADEFLMPNFYFHFVTAYDILRMAGLPVGKADYMAHLRPYVKAV
jgi:hypothetical protein